jgi:hypothetical protein
MADLGEWFMGLAAVHALIGFTVRAQIAFNRFDKPESNSSLFFAGMFADRTVYAGLGLLSILLGNGAIPGVDPLIFLRHVLPLLVVAVCLFYKV